MACDPAGDVLSTVRVLNVVIGLVTYITAVAQVRGALQSVRTVRVGPHCFAAMPTR